MKIPSQERFAAVPCSRANTSVTVPERPDGGKDWVTKLIQRVNSFKISFKSTVI